MKKTSLLLLLPLLLACAGPTTDYVRADAQSVALEARRQEDIARAEQVSATYTPTQLTDENYRPDDRLAMIAGRVMTAAAPYCGDLVEPSFLFTARAMAGNHPRITAPIAVKAAGEKDDIQFGDRIIALNGTPVMEGQKGIAQLKNTLGPAANRQEPVTLSLSRGKAERLVEISIKPVMRCAYGVTIPNSKEVNAYADGKNINFTLPLMDFLTDDELAFVVGHELAHNILQHVQKTQGNAALGNLGGALVDMLAKSQGVNTGGKFGNMGGQIGMMRFSQDFEREADYVGMYITELSGFAPEAAVAVVEKFSIQNPKSITYASTHPANAERAVNNRLTLDEIRRKKRAGQELVPNLRPKEG